MAEQRDQGDHGDQVLLAAARERGNGVRLGKGSPMFATQGGSPHLHIQIIE